MKFHPVLCGNFVETHCKISAPGNYEKLREIIVIYTVNLSGFFKIIIKCQYSLTKNYQ